MGVPDLITCLVKFLPIKSFDVKEIVLGDCRDVNARVWQDNWRALRTSRMKKGTGLILEDPHSSWPGAIGIVRRVLIKFDEAKQCGR